MKFNSVLKNKDKWLDKGLNENLNALKSTVGGLHKWNRLFIHYERMFFF